MKHIFPMLSMMMIWQFIPSIAVGQIQQPTGPWMLINTENGVAFYYRHKESKIEGTVNMIIKLQNNNDYEVQVSYVPTFSCKENDPPTSLEQESIFIEPSCMLAYRISNCVITYGQIVWHSPTLPLKKGTSLFRLDRYCPKVCPYLILMHKTLFFLLPI